MAINNGGPAFARPRADYGRGGNEQDGMSLRDWFAGQALVGIGTWAPGSSSGQLAHPETMAERALFAYQQADAMIAARKAGGE